MSTEEETRTCRKYDLTRTISKYLDLHMMFPLLDFVEMSSIYPADQVAQARLDLLDATNMVSDIIIIIDAGIDRPRPSAPDVRYGSRGMLAFVCIC